MFVAQHYLFSIYHHQILVTDIAISENLQWRRVTLMLTTERRMSEMYDYVIRKPKLCITYTGKGMWERKKEIESLLEVSLCKQ